MPILPRFLADLWNKIKRDSSIPAVEISEDDIVIFVVGPTGSGKSWFTREATRSDLVRVSKHQHPSTGKLQAIRCELTDEARTDPALQGVKNIVFVDTPSFLTGYDLPNAQREFFSWFDRTAYNPRHVGVIYMHRIETEPGIEPIEPHLQELHKTFLLRQTPTPQRVHILISYDTESGTISPSRIKYRKYHLHSQVEELSPMGKWRLSIYEGHFQGEPEVAWKAVEELLNSDGGLL